MPCSLNLPEGAGTFSGLRMLLLVKEKVKTRNSRYRSGKPCTCPDKPNESAYLSNARILFRSSFILHQ